MGDIVIDAARPTELKEHPLIRQLLDLGFDPEHYVVFGSGPLLAYRIRSEIGDLDVVARGKTWLRACDTGIRTTETDGTVTAVRFFDGKIEVFPRWKTSDGTHWDTDALIDTADVIEGIRFARVDNVIRYKQILARPADADDISALMSLKRGDMR